MNCEISTLTGADSLNSAALTIAIQAAFVEVVEDGLIGDHYNVASQGSIQIDEPQIGGMFLLLVNHSKRLVFQN